jgi:molecular chaperone DnaK (HSP70)
LPPSFVIGIDLGTTNSALSYARAEAAADPFGPAGVELLPIPQLTNPGEVREETLLPSFLYLPAASEFPAGTLALPWDAGLNFITGRLAQKRGGENAGRLVSSA